MKGELRMTKAKKFREEVDEVFSTMKEKYWIYVTESGVKNLVFKTFDHSIDRNKYGTVRGYDSMGWMSLTLCIFGGLHRRGGKIFLYNLDNSLLETTHLIISDCGPFVKST
ncbi:hypothetical protein DXG01_006816, partial [Tephrocybe rancida]